METALLPADLKEKKKDLQNKLSRGIAQVLLANFINLAISFCNGFIIPKYLSIPSYAQYKTFLLYTSYVGILHFGFIDGVYIRYGGKNLEDINRKDFSNLHKVLLVSQVAVTGVGLTASLFIKDIYFVLAMACVLPVNMLMFYRMVYQAVGKFDGYRRILNSQAIGVFVVQMIALLAARIDDARVYCLIYLVVTISVWIFFRYEMRYMHTKSYCSFRDMLSVFNDNVGIGYIVMLGNFMSIWMASIDRWFVKIKCSESDFAYYSFAVSLLKLVNAVFSAFSVTLYNYFCDNHDPVRVSSIRRKILLIGSFVISCSFIFRFVIEIVIPKYAPAERVMSFLISSQLFSVLVNAVYLNLYKALKLQKRYLKIMIKISVIAVGLNLIFGVLTNYRMESFAGATLLTSVIWIIFCQVDLRKYRPDIREGFYMLSIICSFFASDMISRMMLSKCQISAGSRVWLNPVMSMSIYLLFHLVFSLLFFRDEIYGLMRNG